MVKVLVLVALFGLAGSAIAKLEGTALERMVRGTTIPPHQLQKRDDTDPSLLYPEYNLSVPIDHFHNDSLYEPHSSDKFGLRYWFDATYYKPGGPVIVLQSGETSGVGRLVFLQKGLLHQLAQATNGIGVVLEHRYYGTSWPVSNLTVESLRFLTTDQALADQAYFAQNVVFKGLEEHDLTAPSAAYIAYGGSYAGGFVAFLRKLYPDVYWGAISSSGVIEAIWDYWSYYSPIQTYAPSTCVEYTQKITHMVDNILIGLNDSTTTLQLKTVFGLPNVTYDNEFASTLTLGINNWQGKNWDPATGSPDFDIYCTNISSPSLIYPSTIPLTSSVQDLLTKGGYASEVDMMTTPMLNYIGWLDQYAISSCKGTQDSCFSTQHNLTYFAQDDITQDWRAWPYQYCTQWGYLQTGSGAPNDTLPLVSRTLDLDYLSLICVHAFNITTPPDVSAINKYGGFNISYPRLAMIDGEWDPWRPATAHASPFNETVVNRTDTISEPFIMIPGAVHHWDENGLFDNETVNGGGHSSGDLPPATVRDVQEREIEFVRKWMGEWEVFVSERESERAREMGQVEVEVEREGEGHGNGDWDRDRNVELKV